jgi:hypothetical protein
MLRWCIDGWAMADATFTAEVWLTILFLDLFIPKDFKWLCWTSLAQRPIFHEDERTVMVLSNGAGGAMPEIGLLSLKY